MDGLREFFGNYRAFEERKSLQLARSQVPEQEKHFKHTASVYHTKKRYQRQLTQTLCMMDSSEGFDLMHRWRLYLEYEKSNPLTCGTEQFRAYVVFAYKCALTCLRFCSLIWHEYAQFMIEEGDASEALAVYAQAIEALPDCLMLNFSYAELLESRKRSGEAIPVYRALIERQRDPGAKTLATLQFLKFLQRTEGPASMRKEFIMALQTRECTYHLVLKISSVENLVNQNRSAAVKILLMGVEIHGREREFLEAAVRELLNMKAHQEVAGVIAHAKAVLPPPRLVEMYKNMYDQLVFSVENEALMAQVEQEILALDRTVTPESLALKRFFLPPDYVDRPI
jgi:tetratricopeptide (TPR) repeat protein